MHSRQFTRVDVHSYYIANLAFAVGTTSSSGKQSMHMLDSHDQNELAIARPG